MKNEVSVEEARSIILQAVGRLGVERVGILEAAGRVLAEDIVAGRSIPPLDNSAMDGYALRAADIEKAAEKRPAVLCVLEDLPAGYLASRKVGPGEAIRIMTGAPLPEGADTVVQKELTDSKGSEVRVRYPLSRGANIRRAGEDVEQGAAVLEKGSVIKPASVGMLASLGRSFVSVWQRPRVAILSTGDELIDVDGEYRDGRIVASNSYTLFAQCRTAGAIPTQLGIAVDKKEVIAQKLREGLVCDLIISTGGVSVGDYDYIKEVLGELGSDMKFWHVQMRPGWPLVFGLIEGKPTFGLPGNPVSSMVSFEQFVRPAILKMSGHDRIYRRTIRATLLERVKKKPGKTHFMRCHLVEGEGKGASGYGVRLTGEQGSGILLSMVKGDGLLVVDPGVELLEPGTEVTVQVLDDGFGYQEEPGI